MIIKDEQTKEFLKTIKEAENILLSIDFRLHSYVVKGYAHFFQFKKSHELVEFIWGPPEYEVVMIIYTENRKFEFKDLLSIPLIALWVKEHRYIQGGKRNIHNEVFWFIELLEFSLSIIEG